MSKSIGILGGGISAAALAYFLPSRGYNITVIEKELVLGGLAKSLVRNDFIFDIGPHIVFAKNNSTLKWMSKMLGDDDQKIYRNNSIYFKGRYIKYPFENGLHMLPPEDIYECLYYFINNDFKKPPLNFKQWVYATFGKGIAEKYLIPYNEKIWKIDPAQLSLKWIGGRVPRPPVEDILKSAVGVNTEGYQHQVYFHYPKTGGIQTLVNNIYTAAKKRKQTNLKVITHCEVKSVSRLGAGWVVEDAAGERRFFDIIINTMPLHTLAAAGEFLPHPIKRLIKKLRYNSLALVLLGFNAPYNSNRFAVYFPQPDILFHRLVFNNYLSPQVSPRGKFSVSLEITFREGDATARMSDSQVIRQVLSSLRQEKIVNTRTLCFSEVVRIQYEYPVYDFNYEPVHSKVFTNFAKINNFYSCGRFAEFMYLNMNDCIERAQALAKRLAL